MKILFVSNFFPPQSRGGYELWCQEVAMAMHCRGHVVSILTSRSVKSFPHQEPYQEEPFSVYRVLSPEVSGGVLQTMKRLLSERKTVERENIATLHRILKDLQPDVVFIWGMWNIPRAVPAAVEATLPGRVVYYFCDYWPTLPNAYVQRWEEPARHKYAHLLKQVVGKLFLARLLQEQQVALQFEHPVCVSRAVRQLLVDAGVPVQHAAIIYGGTQVEEFSALASCPRQAIADGLKLVFLGRLVKDKGVHTAIEALGLLSQATSHPVILDIYGDGDAAYKALLVSLIEKYHLENAVSLRGSIARASVPGLLAHYHALVFPSVWEEPFARTPLEAMAAGVTVIGSITGGTGEILVDGESGLTFAAEDAKTLAEKLLRLIDEPGLCAELAKNAYEQVHQHFTFERMVNAMEELLQIVSASADSTHLGGKPVER